MDEDSRKEKKLEAAVQSQPTTSKAAEELDMIFRDHHKLVFQAAYRVTGNATDAEDVLQTVFVRLARRSTGSGLTGNPAGYLHRAAVNAALDVIRSRKAARSSSLEDLAPVLEDDGQVGPEQARRDSEIRNRVRQALTKLNPKTAEVFTLRYFEGYGNNEIAKMLGTSRSTIAVMLHRARNSLREEIKDLAGELS